MSKGLLEVHGTLSVQQFWPRGTYDADTAHVGVSKFLFGPSAAKLKETRVFRSAVVKRSQGAKAGQAPISKKGEIIVRLQRIDAPELHFRPTYEHTSVKQKAAIKNHNGDFRQPLGEGAANALYRLVQGLGSDPVPCIVRTRVNKPNDVFDMFGRLVGDIYVKLGAREVDLNHWVLQHGWAFPTFYTSMQDDEIEEILSIAAAAEKAGKGVWASYTAKPTNLNLRLLNPGANATFAGAKDKGQVTMPKLFRRASTWSVGTSAKLFTGTFGDYLRAHSDECWTTKSFLSGGAAETTKKHLHDFISSSNVFTSTPGGLVFGEGNSFVVDKNGKAITGF